jgi:hypothetical protein
MEAFEKAAAGGTLPDVDRVPPCPKANEGGAFGVDEGDLALEGPAESKGSSKESSAILLS